MITITDKGIAHLKSLAQENNSSYVRLSLNGGGCAGLTYDWSFENEDGYTKSDALLEDVLLVDRMFEMYILGMTLDWVVTPFKAEFKFDNPQSKMTCGCGESFSVNINA